MARIQPLDIENAPEKSRALLEAVQKKVGFAPNLYRSLAHAPSVLEGFLGFGQSLNAGTLPAKLREQIALAIAGANTCDYCASAHTAIGSNLGLPADELAANLRGESNDPATHAALQFALAVNTREGFVTDEQIQTLREAGYDEGQIVEVFAQTIANIFTNYFNHLAQTDIDFPLVKSGEAAAA